MLWLALHLPLLSLESFAALLPGHVPEQPLALADAHGIASANAAALEISARLVVDMR